MAARRSAARGRRAEAAIAAAILALSAAAAHGLGGAPGPGDVWRPEPVATWVSDLFRQGPVEGAPNWATGAKRVVDGDPERGRALARAYGCGACHRAPGIGFNAGGVGPDLHGFADRAYVAGILPNRPGALIAWLRDPPAQAPRTAMPDMGVTEEDARDLAAWLYTLRGA